MLVPDFYHIAKFVSIENKVEAQIILNKDHKIYKGHFPGQHVVPGVMQLQMIKEMVEKAVASELILSDITAAKFLQMIVPSNSGSINIEIDLLKLNENQVKINAKIFSAESVFTKLKAVLTTK